MKEFKIKNAVVRIHGTADREKIEAATIQYIKKVERQRRKKDEKTKQ